MRHDGSGMVGAGAARAQEPKFAWHVSLYQRRYKSGQFRDSAADPVTTGNYPVKMRQSAAARNSLVFIVMIAIVLPPLPSGRIVLAARPNQLDSPLKGLQGHLGAASTEGKVESLSLAGAA